MHIFDDCTLKLSQEIFTRHTIGINRFQQPVQSIQNIVRYSSAIVTHFERKEQIGFIHDLIVLRNLNQRNGYRLVQQCLKIAVRLIAIGTPRPLISVQHLIDIREKRFHYNHLFYKKNNLVTEP